MRKRIKSVTVTVAALAALALGGSALAIASDSSSPGAPEKVSATDAGPAVQQGDQTTPDGAVIAQKHAVEVTSESESGNDPAGANDTTSPDSGRAASENAPENASETGPSDGPGGHEDAPGNPNAENQEEGER